VLSSGDDYPIHQTPDPVALAGTDRNFYDRYFFNGYTAAGDVYFAAALGVYPQLNIMDAAFSVVVEGRQLNLHASRILGADRMDTRVGPIEIRVIEPLRVLQVLVDDPEHGVAADLVFRGRSPVVGEPRYTRRTGTRVFMDMTRMTQNGRWSGTITASRSTTPVCGAPGTAPGGSDRWGRPTPSRWCPRPRRSSSGCGPR
jgi:hypothetical protein